MYTASSQFPGIDFVSKTNVKKQNLSLATTKKEDQNWFSRPIIA